MDRPESVHLGHGRLTPEDVLAVASGAPVSICNKTRRKVDAARAPVEGLLGDGADSVYGVNTGFGALAEVRVGAADLARLQVNLIRSHSCGLGAPYPQGVVRGMLALRLEVLAQGHSGVRTAVIELLADMLNAGVHPVVPRKGSVGASGDLAPLAHLALVLIGEGEAELGGVVMPGGEALAQAGLVPLELAPKEGLALINGTQAMTSEAALTLLEAERLVWAADVACAMTVEALLGSHRPYDQRFADLRPHPGHRVTSAHLRALLQGSEINATHQDDSCHKVQDPYSLRCAPQVQGATRDALVYVRATVQAELRAVTDNPLVFVDDDGGAEFLSGGNFHGQAIALAMDHLAIAVAELADISERRIEQLVNPMLSGLPPFLAPDPGLTSGFMIAQVAAASVVSENKVLSHPASVDSIPSSANREDHVSMGTLAAAKARTVVENVRSVLATEMLCAAQALELRAPHRPGHGVAAAFDCIRAHVPPLTEDRRLDRDVATVAALIDGELHDAVRTAMPSASDVPEHPQGA